MNEKMSSKDFRGHIALTRHVMSGFYLMLTESTATVSVSAIPSNLFSKKS